MQIIFMGSPEFAVASLGALIHSHHKVELVVTQPDKKAGRGQNITPCPIAIFAAEHGLPVEKPATLKGNSELSEKLRHLAPDIVIVVAYGKILPPEFLKISKKGCVNVHASLLPMYRGASPINWAIINGDTKTGVTTMLINERMDEGDILLQCATEITPEDTAGTLSEHLSAIGADLLLKTLERIEKSGLKGIPQEHDKATYTQKLKKEDGLIDWSAGAREIYNRVRGLQPWPGAYTSSGERLAIFDTAVIDIDSAEKPGTIVSVEKGIIVATGKGQLCILEVQVAGKKRMMAVEFVKGAKLKAGDRFV